MTKIIRFKNGKCVKIECCGRCPAGNRDGLPDRRFTRCGFTAYVHDSNSLPSIPGRTACPLDDYDPPQTFLKDKVVRENSELREIIAQHEQHLRDFPLKTLYERQIAYRAENFESNSKLIAEMAALRERLDTHVKRLWLIGQRADILWNDPGYWACCVHASQPPNVCPYVPKLLEYGSEKTKCPKQE